MPEELGRAVVDPFVALSAAAAAGASDRHSSVGSSGGSPCHDHHHETHVAGVHGHRHGSSSSGPFVPGHAVRTSSSSSMTGSSVFYTAGGAEGVVFGSPTRKVSGGG